MATPSKGSKTKVMKDSKGGSYTVSKINVKNLDRRKHPAIPSSMNPTAGLKLNPSKGGTATLPKFANPVSNLKQPEKKSTNANIYNPIPKSPGSTPANIRPTNTYEKLDSQGRPYTVSKINVKNLDRKKHPIKGNPPSSKNK